MLIRGKNGKTSTLLAVGVVALLVILGVLAYAVITQQQAVPTPGAVPVGTPSTGSGCNVNPSVVNAVTDTLQPGTAVTTTPYFKLNGQYVGTTSPTTPGTTDILYTAAGYLPKIKTGVPIGCGSNLVTDTMYANTTGTWTFYSNNGLTQMADASGNESAQAAGSAYNWKFHEQGTDKKNTGQVMMIIEGGTPSNVSSITVSGATSVPIPSGFTRVYSSYYGAAFLLPPLIGNNVADFNVQVNPATSKGIAGNFSVTFLYLQPFVDTDGTFKDGSSAYDSVNTQKYAANATKKFVIV